MGRRDSRLATYGPAAAGPPAITRLPYLPRPLSLEWILPLPEGSSATLTLGLLQDCPLSAQNRKSALFRCHKLQWQRDRRWNRPPLSQGDHSRNGFRNSGTWPRDSEDPRLSCSSID